AAGRTSTVRASSASPPASANANGTKPAARRDWESETSSEKWTNSVGTSSSARIAREPPRTDAPERRRDAEVMRRPDLQLLAVVLEARDQALLGGIVRVRLVDERADPQQAGAGRDGGRDECRRGRAPLSEAHDGERGERD